MIAEENDKLYVSEEIVFDDGINNDINANNKKSTSFTQQELSRVDDIFECVINEIRY